MFTREPGFTSTAEHQHREAEEQRYQEARAARERFEERWPVEEPESRADGEPRA